ncbi:hypothetical protein cyc_09416 [Cyclospora cayetanensis]|uniref:Uncharacterized protein n=1 Tax=Cyclospora cayetanensis TaxID=88456 RepID=A0A1D3D5U4_9EIME|nr:hypothetical protein cyc_09416 [Cyclospora cayetanensis]
MRSSRSGSRASCCTHTSKYAYPRVRSLNTAHRKRLEQPEIDLTQEQQKHLENCLAQAKKFREVGGEDRQVQAVPAADGERQQRRGFGGGKEGQGEADRARRGRCEEYEM